MAPQIDPLRFFRPPSATLNKGGRELKRMPCSATSATSTLGAQIASRLRYLIALPVAVLALSFVSPPRGLAAEPGWHPPVDLSPGYLYTYPQIAADNSGGFLHAWEEKQLLGSLTGDSRLTVNARKVAASGVPGVPVTLPGLTFYGASLAANGQGDAILAWDEHEDYCCVTLSAALQDDGAGFAEPIDVDYGSGVVTQVRTAMNSLGDGAIAYGVHYSDNTSGLWIVFRRAGGDFGEPIELMSPHPSPQRVYDLNLGLSDTGEAVLAWGSMDGIARAAIVTESGVQDLTTLSQSGRAAYQADVAVDPAGGAVVGWHYPGYDDPSPDAPAYIATRLPGADFGPPVRIGNSQESGWLDAETSADGRALVSFITDDFLVAVRPVNLVTGVLGRETVFPDTTGFARIAVGPEGQAVVAIDQDFDETTLVAWGNASGCFGPARVLTSKVPWYSLQDPVVGPEGNAAVLLLDRGLITGSDQDDRSAVATSDTLLGTYPSPCEDVAGATRPQDDPGSSPPDAGELVGPPPTVARLELRVPHKVHVARSGKVPVEVLSTAAGTVKLSSRSRGLSGFSDGDAETLDGPGVAELKLKLAGGAFRTLERAGHTGVRLRLVAKLHADGQPAKARATVVVWR